MIFLPNLFLGEPLRISGKVPSDILTGVIRLPVKILPGPVAVELLLQAKKRRAFRPVPFFSTFECCCLQTNQCLLTGEGTMIVSLPEVGQRQVVARLTSQRN